jgi:hypothetical protein
LFLLDYEISELPEWNISHLAAHFGTESHPLVILTEPVGSSRLTVSPRLYRKPSYFGHVYFPRYRLYYNLGYGLFRRTVISSSNNDLDTIIIPVNRLSYIKLIRL